MNAKTLKPKLLEAIRILEGKGTLEDALFIMRQLAIAEMPKTRGKKIKLKGAPGYDHPYDGCRLCEAYRDDFSRALWLDGMVLFPQGKANMTNLAKSPTYGVSDYKDQIRATLSVCACGHSADQHMQDELDNLLECHATDGVIGDEYRKPCNCDHFHYETEESEEEAA